MRQGGIKARDLSKPGMSGLDLGGLSGLRCRRQPASQSRCGAVWCGVVWWGQMDVPS
jgi:hypothetical protein